MSYEDKLIQAINPANQKLLRIVIEKRSNLAVSIDLTKTKEFLELVEMVAPYVCMVKTHIDILEDFNWSFIEKLLALAQKYKFTLFEDRKFADIGNTVKLQYQKGIYRISDWADFTNAHLISGPGIVTALKQVGLAKGRSLLLLAEMSSKGSLINSEYTLKNVTLAQEHTDFVGGFICQRKLSDNPCFLHFSPGIQLENSIDTLDQQYVTPEKAFLENKTDIAIVGRGIYSAPDPQKQAKLYQEVCFDSYLRRR